MTVKSYAISSSPKHTAHKLDKTDKTSNTKDIIGENNPESKAKISKLSEHPSGDITEQESNVIYVTSKETCEPIQVFSGISGVSSAQNSDGSKTVFSNGDTVTAEDEDEEAAAHGKAFCWGICCVQGCIWGIIGMLYFFVFLPSGFLLILLGTNKKLTWAIATGSVLLVMSSCGVPALCVCVKWYRRKQRDRRTAYRAERNKQVAEVTYENQIDTQEVIT